MLTQKTNKFIFPIKRFYFGYNPENDSFFHSIFGITEIINITKKSNLNGFHEEKFNTGIIDLNKSIDDIFKNFSATKRNEINRAEKEGIKYEFIEKIDKDIISNYIDYYNIFAKSKGLKKISLKFFDGIIENLFITKAILNEKILVYNTYLFDKEIKKVRLLHSCSHFRIEENLNKNLISWANNGLHFFNIKLFKEKGFNYYDFGGLYLGDTDQAKINIDKFKLSFGPEIIELYNYTKYGIIFKIIFKLLGKKY